MNLVKIVGSVDTDALLEAYSALEEKIVWTDMGKGKQAGLQHRVNEDPWTSAVGRSNGNEISYTELNPFFKDTIFEELINKYNLLKTRFMWVYPMSCYSMHKDETPRIHIPLVTNPGNYFVFKQTPPLHLTTGVAHWTDTRMFHTFMNCSDLPRLHIVGAVNQ
jgi:hypothetical protein